MRTGWNHSNSTPFPVLGLGGKRGSKSDKNMASGWQQLQLEKRSRLCDPCLDISILHTSLFEPLISPRLINPSPTNITSFFSRNQTCIRARKGAARSAQQRQASNRSAAREATSTRFLQNLLLPESELAYPAHTGSSAQPARGGEEIDRFDNNLMKSHQFPHLQTETRFSESCKYLQIGSRW
jgi:hypothetical protein